jgi:predicted KAP-like P-loop ATPase
MGTPLGLDVDELINGESLPDKIESIDTFQKSFEIRLSDYLDSNGKLFIYIDDLDRCSSDHAVEIIEAINLFLETKKCVFIIGMDYNLISTSIEIKYKEISQEFNKSHYNESNTPSTQNYSENFNNHPYGEYFLKKIIQIPITIPTLNQNELTSFTEEVMRIEIPKSSTQESPPEEIYSIEKSTISIDQIIKDITSTLLPYIEANPRAIKRYYNMLSFIQFFYIANRQKFNDVNDIALTLWFFLLYKYPNTINRIFSHDKPISWSNIISGCDGNCKDIQNFLSGYLSENQDLFTGKLEGNLNNYYSITRILTI